MAKQGMTKQETKALVSAWSDANDMVVKNGEKRRKAAAKKTAPKKK